MVEVSPSSNNTVPGHLMMTVDIRHPQQAHYDDMVSGSYEIVRQACDGLQLPNVLLHAMLDSANN